MELWVKIDMLITEFYVPDWKTWVNDKLNLNNYGLIKWVAQQS